MRKFKVLVIAHSLKQNKIAKFDERVSESQLTSPADELVSTGFLEEVFEDVNEIEVDSTEIEKEEVFEDVKKEIKDIKKPFIKK